jgi:hypothetical protein
MFALSISFLVFVLMWAGALARVTVRPLLSETHFQPGSREVVKVDSHDVEGWSISLSDFRMSFAPSPRPTETDSYVLPRQPSLRRLRRETR